MHIESLVAEHKERTNALLSQRPSFIIQDASPSREPVATEEAVCAREYTVMTVGGKGASDVVVLPSKLGKSIKVKKHQSTVALKQELVSQSNPVAQQVELISPPTDLTKVTATATEPKLDLETKPAPIVVADDPFKHGKIATDFFLAGSDTFYIHRLFKPFRTYK